MKVKFVPQNVEFEIKPGQSVMHLAEDNGLYVKSVCRGVPSCAECRVKIVEGEANVFAPVAAELGLIGSGHFIDRRRLACQLQCMGDVTVDMSEQIAKQQGLMGGRKAKAAKAIGDRVEDETVIRDSSTAGMRATGGGRGGRGHDRDGARGGETDADDADEQNDIDASGSGTEAGRPSGGGRSENRGGGINRGRGENRGGGDKGRRDAPPKSNVVIGGPKSAPSGGGNPITIGGPTPSTNARPQVGTGTVVPDSGPSPVAPAAGSSGGAPSGGGIQPRPPGAPQPGATGDRPQGGTRDGGGQGGGQGGGGGRSRRGGRRR